MKPGLLFFCHGARDASWRAPFDDILKRFRAGRPDVPAELAFLELMEPGFEQAIERLVAAGAARIDVVPLFLAPGSHTRRDLPALLAQAQVRWPALQFRVAPTMTESEAMRAAVVTAAVAWIG